jgi:hypothetical protein
LAHRPALPAAHPHRTPAEETIYEQIDRVRSHLAEEAAKLIDDTCAAPKAM